MYVFSSANFLNVSNQLFVYASGAQDVLTRGAASSPTGRALAAGVGLMLAVYCGFNASGNILVII